MSPGLYLLMIKLLVCGPVADLYWLVNVEETVQAIRSREPLMPGRSGFHGRWWVDEGRNRATFHAAAGSSTSRRGYRVQLRVERREDRELLGASLAVELGMGRWRLLAGPARGGMGVGLLVGERAWNTTGAEVRSAWTGVPSRLRVGPVSEAYPRPQVIALQYGGRRQAVLAVMQERGSAPYLVSQWHPSETLRAVLVRSNGFMGAEAAAGRREGEVHWRISAASWKFKDAGDGSSVEAAASSRSREASCEVRLWSWQGLRSPLAPPPAGAVDDRRVGGRLAVEMRPVARMGVAVALETAVDSFDEPRSLWRRSQLLVTIGSTSEAGIRLRIQKTEQTTSEPWVEQRRDWRWLMDLRLRSGSSGRVRWHGGLRRQAERARGASNGIWLQAEQRGRVWRGYLRGTLSLPVPGIPLYWFEPGPAYGWNLHMESGRRVRFLIGALNAAIGWHMQLIADSSGSVGFKAAWRYNW
jgi:hypothetical protein